MKLTWKTKVVKIDWVKPTRNNFKLKTESGQTMFETSVKNYGRAGVVICNLDGELINGNTNWKYAKKQGDKTIEVSLPNRKLTPKEFKEFSAMFDQIRAGEVDINRIHEELGTTASFFKKWGMDIPMTAQNKLQELEKNEGNIKATIKERKAEEQKELKLKPITLLLTVVESDEYIKLAESLYARFKVDNVTDLSMRIIRQIKKTK